MRERAVYYAKIAERTGADEELARLVEAKFIPDNIASIVYTDELDSFFAK